MSGNIPEQVNFALERQRSRGYVPQFRQDKLEREAAANWDRFYKRNETRFFKDRHWTMREFKDLLPQLDRTLILLEVGCGVGNFLYPLLEEPDLDLFVHACDFSARAVDFVRSDPRFVASRVHAFVMDVCRQPVVSEVCAHSVDVVSLIFVLSAVAPGCHSRVLANIVPVMRCGSVLLFRDYARHDIAQLRFKPGHLLSDNFYVKQDGTRVYYFTVEELTDMFEAAGFVTVSCQYVSRQTVNKKENVDVQRTFIQGVFKLCRDWQAESAEAEAE